MRESRSTRSAGRIVSACLFLAGCASVDPRPDHEEARARIRSATGRDEVFDPEAPLLTESEIAAATADGLSLDEALRLALLNNRRLQAGFMEIGVARADFVQAGLLRNPGLSVAFLFPSGGGTPKITADLLGSVADLWEIPARKEIQRAELSRQILEVSRFAGELVAETKSAYFESVAARERLATATAGLDLARRSHDAVRQRIETGVAGATDENLAQGELLAAELALRRTEREIVTTRRRLGSLLSLESDLLDVEFTDPIPEAAALDLDREALVARGRESRLDVRASGSAVEAAAARLSLEERRLLTSIDLGVSAERPETGSSVDLLVGPSLSIGLPIFDQNQAKTAGAAYRVLLMRKEHEALCADVAQGIRASVDRAASAARTAEFVSGRLLPQAEQGSALVKEAYELGATTVLQLLESQRAVLAAREDGIETRLEAARSRIELERAAGAPLASLTGG